MTLTYVEPVKRSHRAPYTVNIYGDDAYPMYCNFIVDQTNNVSLEQCVEAVLSVYVRKLVCYTKNNYERTIDCLL